MSRERSPENRTARRITKCRDRGRKGRRRALQPHGVDRQLHGGQPGAGPVPAEPGPGNERGRSPGGRRRIAASVMADRSQGSYPHHVLPTNPVSKLFTQFQLEVNNQLSYVFKDMPREKKNMGVRALAAALLKFALGHGCTTRCMSISSRPGARRWDPHRHPERHRGRPDRMGTAEPGGAGAWAPATGDMPDFQVEQPGLYETVANLGTAAAEELPFIGGLLGGGRPPHRERAAGHHHPGKSGHRRRVGSVQTGSRRHGTRSRSPSPIW